MPPSAARTARLARGVGGGGGGGGGLPTLLRLKAMGKGRRAAPLPRALRCHTARSAKGHLQTAREITGQADGCGAEKSHAAVTVTARAVDITVTMVTPHKSLKK